MTLLPLTILKTSISFLLMVYLFVLSFAFYLSDKECNGNTSLAVMVGSLFAGTSTVFFFSSGIYRFFPFLVLSYLVAIFVSITNEVFFLLPVWILFFSQLVHLGGVFSVILCALCFLTYLPAEEVQKWMTIYQEKHNLKITRFSEPTVFLEPFTVKALSTLLLGTTVSMLFLNYL